MRRLLIGAGCAAILGGVVHAQPRFGPGEEGPQILFYETVQLPAEGDPGKGRIDVYYRIDREFFVPVKNSDASIPHEFIRRGEVLVEMVDTTGATAGRALERIDVGEVNAERKPMGREWQQGIFSFVLRPGAYKVQITIDDLESRRSLTEKNRTVHVAGVLRPGLATASAMFIAPAADSSLPAIIAPTNFGGEVLFGTPSALVIVWSAGPGGDSAVSATLTLAERPPADEDRDFLPAPSVLTARVQHGVALRPAGEGGTASYDVGRNGTAALAILPFPSEKLLLRSYTLTAVLGSGTERKDLTMKFRVVWPAMPFSLKDIDYALEALRYIATEDQLDSLRRGSMESRRKHLEEFWRKRDKTPETAFNEVETEYYRRVDHASRNFGTLRQPDGFRTDRGRIYVLYGPPTATERSLDPEAGYQEVWVYGHLNRRFTFVDQNKSGNYVLVTTSP